MPPKTNQPTEKEKTPSGALKRMAYLLGCEVNDLAHLKEEEVPWPTTYPPMPLLAVKLEWRVLKSQAERNSAGSAQAQTPATANTQHIQTAPTPPTATAHTPITLMPQTQTHNAPTGAPTHTPITLITAPQTALTANAQHIPTAPTPAITAAAPTPQTRITLTQEAQAAPTANIMYSHIQTAPTPPIAPTEPTAQTPITLMPEAQTPPTANAQHIEAPTPVVTPAEGTPQPQTTPFPSPIANPSLKRQRSPSSDSDRAWFPTVEFSIHKANLDDVCQLEADGALRRLGVVGVFVFFSSPLNVFQFLESRVKVQKNNFAEARKNEQTHKEGKRASFYDGQGKKLSSMMVNAAGQDKVLLAAAAATSLFGQIGQKKKN